MTAGKLRARLNSEDRVVLVDKSDRHYFAPSFPWVMNGWRTPDKAHRELSALSRKGIEFIQGEVTNIDVERQTVTSTSRELNWDYLVIALGAEMTYDNTPGLEESSHTYYSLDGAVRLREALNGVNGGTILVTVGGVPYRCPAAPYEGAFLIDHLLRERGIRDRFAMKFLTPEPGPLPVAGPDIGVAVEGMLKEREIDYHSKTPITRVDVENSTAIFSDNREEKFDLLVTIPQHRAPGVLAESGLVGDSGWLEVDRQTLATEHPNVYALGDATFIKLASGLPLPKAGVFAHRQAEVVAENIASQIQRGKDGDARFDGHGS